GHSFVRKVRNRSRTACSSCDRPRSTVTAVPFACWIPRALLEAVDDFVKYRARRKERATRGSAETPRRTRPRREALLAFVNGLAVVAQGHERIRLVESLPTR